jgi:hypothetical protein
MPALTAVLEAGDLAPHRHPRRGARAGRRRVVQAQASGHLGWFEPATGRTELVALGSGSSPHGVIQGPDRAAWLTDGGQNAIVRVAGPTAR